MALQESIFTRGETVKIFKENSFKPLSTNTCTSGLLGRVDLRVNPKNNTGLSLRFTIVIVNLNLQNVDSYI